MKITNDKELHDFIGAINECERPVWLESINGEKYDLKDELDRYCGIAQLIKGNRDDLELFTTAREDTVRMVNYFSRLSA